MEDGRSRGWRLGLARRQGRASCGRAATGAPWLVKGRNSPLMRGYQKSAPKGSSSAGLPALGLSDLEAPAGMEHGPPSEVERVLTALTTMESTHIIKGYGSGDQPASCFEAREPADPTGVARKGA